MEHKVESNYNNELKLKQILILSKIVEDIELTKSEPGSEQIQRKEYTMLCWRRTTTNQSSLAAT